MMAKLKFEGSKADFQDFLEDLGIKGRWSEEPNGVYMLRCPCGAQVHWSSTKMTVWVSGKPRPKARLERRIMLALPSPELDDSDLLEEVNDSALNH